MIPYPEMLGRKKPTASAGAAIAIEDPALWGELNRASAEWRGAS
ncbi:hypothetical protein [Laspinema palackyanum]